jgi:RND superfamily putative drug exporter
MLLVPAFMRVLGKVIWWAPKPLARLYDRLGISEAYGPVDVRPATEADDRVVRAIPARAGR